MWHVFSEQAFPYELILLHHNRLFGFESLARRLSKVFGSYIFRFLNQKVLSHLITTSSKLNYLSSKGFEILILRAYLILAAFIVYIWRLLLLLRLTSLSYACLIRSFFFLIFAWLRPKFKLELGIFTSSPSSMYSDNSKPFFWP